MTKPIGTKDKLKRCGREEFFKLTQWMNNERERLLKERPTLSSLARKLTAQFGCNIHRNLVREAQTLTGIVWTATDTYTSNSIPALRSRLRMANNRIRLLTEVVDFLVTEIGVKPPPAMALLKAKDLIDEEDAADEGSSPRTIPIGSHKPGANGTGGSGPAF